MFQRKLRSKYTLVSSSGKFEKDQENKVVSSHRDQSFKELFSSHIREESDSDTETTEKEFFSPQTEHLSYFSAQHSEDEQTPRHIDNPLYSHFKYNMADEKPEDDSIVPQESKTDQLDTTLIEEGEELVPSEGEDTRQEDIAKGDEIDDITNTENATQENVTDENEGGAGTDFETEDEDMREVEQMIEAASHELQSVVEQNEKIMDSLKDEVEVAMSDQVDEAKTPAEGGDGSFFKLDPSIESAVLKELEAAEEQAKQTATIVRDLRNRVGELLKKEKMTEKEAKELEEKNMMLKSQMAIFEEKIKRIQFLITQTNLFENMVPAQPPLQQKHNVDGLPKVIVCGYGENNIPKIIVCEDRNKKRCKSAKKPGETVTSPRVRPNLINPMVLF